MRRIALLLCLLGSPALAAPTPQQIARRKLAQPTLDGRALRDKLLKPMRYASKSYSGHTVERPTSEHDKASILEQYNEALSRLTELDPDRTLLSPAEWTHVEDQLRFGATHQVRNKEEHIEVALKDPALQLSQTRFLVEKARGKLAAQLAKALRGKKPDPETLAHVCDELGKTHSFFENPFRVEAFIEDMGGVQPRLARWDFGKEAAGAIKLPLRLHRVVRDLGQRVFHNVNVLFADHMYEDGVVMIDAMRAAGLDTSKTRFVATPYPFDPAVRAKYEARGVKTSTAPYSKEQTKAHLEQSIRELLALSKDNHGPILVFDDGGMATEIIATKFADEMHRFRIIEITKAGERIGKVVLPKALGMDYEGLGKLDRTQMAAMKEKYLDATSWDGPSRTAAEQQWTRIQEHVRIINISPGRNQYRESPQNTISARSHGFAYYTYANSGFKREAMTPLYTQAVNRATFEALEHEGKTLPNNRVTIIGAGAMGLNAGLELRERGFEVTFVDPDPVRRAEVEKTHGFATSELKPALKGRGLILEMSGAQKILTADHLFLIDDGAFVAHGSSKDNPFDMETIKALASETIAWKPSPTGQSSASYVFEAMGRKTMLHFPGNGYTISHGGKAQNVPLDAFLPEIDALMRLGAHAVTQPTKATQLPIFGTPAWLMQPGAQRKQLAETKLTLE